VWRNKKGTGFVDSKITCLLQAGKKKMGLIPVAMMKWMENLNVFVRGRDHREVSPMGSVEIGAFPLQRKKRFLNIKGDRVNSLLEFPPLFLPCQVPLDQRLLPRHTD
jgi:hypothetical protein